MRAHREKTWRREEPAFPGPPVRRRAVVFTVLYDGDCPLCRTSVSRLTKWDREGVFEFLPAQDETVSGRFPGIAPTALSGSLHLVSEDGESWVGAEAVEQIIRLLPGWRWSAWAFRLPFGRPFAQRVYRWIAKNRYRLNCPGHCGE